MEGWFRASVRTAKDDNDERWLLCISQYSSLTPCNTSAPLDGCETPARTPRRVGSLSCEDAMRVLFCFGMNDNNVDHI